MTNMDRRNFLEDVFIVFPSVAGRILEYLPIWTWARLTAVSKSVRQEMRFHTVQLDRIKESDIFPLWISGHGPARQPDSLRKFGKPDSGATDWLINWAPQISELKFHSNWFYEPLFIPFFLTKFSNLSHLSLTISPGNEEEVIGCLQENSGSLIEIRVTVDGIAPLADFRPLVTSFGPFPKLKRLKLTKLPPKNFKKPTQSHEKFYLLLSRLLSSIKHPELLESLDLVMELKRPDKAAMEILRDTVSRAISLEYLSVAPLIYCSEVILFADCSDLEHFITDNSDFSTLSMLCPKFPNLSSLTIKRKSVLGMNTNEAAFLTQLATSCPKLETLNLINSDGFTPNLASNSFLLPSISELKNLKFLRIDCVNEQEHFWLLSKLTILESLSLGFSGKFPLSSRPHGPLHVDLPNLKYLSLHSPRNRICEFSLLSKLNPGLTLAIDLKNFSILPEVSQSTTKLILKNCEETTALESTIGKFPNIRIIEILNAFHSVSDIFNSLRRIAAAAERLQEIRLHLGAWNTVMIARRMEILEFEKDMRDDYRIRLCILND